MSDPLDEIRATLKELADADQRLQERQEATQRMLDVITHDIANLMIASQQDGENIRPLARIPELHDRRLTE